MDFQDGAIYVAAKGEGWQERAEEYGERAFRIKGESLDVVYWDIGNGWSSIITALPHSGNEAVIAEFWNRLLDIAPYGELEEEEEEYEEEEYEDDCDEEEE